MAKIELYNLLRTFSGKEITGFQLYLKSPYFGDKKKLFKLFFEIIKYYPLFTDCNLSKKLLSGKLFPQLKFKDSTMRNLFSDLHKEALYFLQIENFKRSGLYRYNFLFNELKIKGLQNEFTKISSNPELTADDKLDWVYFLNRHFFETYKFNFSYHNVKLRNPKDLQDEISYLNNSINYLIYFFISELVSLYIDYLNYKKSYNIDNLTHNIEQAFGLINFNKASQALARDKSSFVIKIYSALTDMYSNIENDYSYFRYKKLFFNNIKKLSNDEIRFNYFNLISYCSIKILSRQLDYDFENEQFVLYKQLLENNYYLDRNTFHLPHELYRNILARGLRNKEFKWIAAFVDEYSYRVHPQDRENMFNFGKANLDFNLGSYETALKYINKIDQTYFIYKVDIKNLTLMIYYELGYTEEALSFAKSYREFMRKNKLVNRERQKRYVNFSKIIEKLTLFKAGSFKHDASFIRQQIIQNKNIAFKEWLLEKIEFQVSESVKAGYPTS